MAEAALTPARGGRGGRGAEPASDEAPAPAGGGRGGRDGTVAQFKTLLRDPSLRDPRGFIVPSDQPDFPTATKFVNALIKTGVTVHRATAAFMVGGKTYPAGSYVVKSAQPFRPHVLDMFEPQDHPDDVPYPGGPPTRPYDNAGWTLAYQMGVKFDRILEGFDGPFERLNGLQTPAPGKAASAANVILDHSGNNAFVAVNRLLAAGRDVRWTQGAGNPFYITGASPSELQKLATELGVNFEAAPASVSVNGAVKLRRPRIGLADVYGGSISSGWTRFVLEQFEFPFEVIYPKVVDAANLASRFDVLIFPSDVGPAPAAGGRGGGRGGVTPAPNIPAEFEPTVGSYTAEQTGPALKKFLEDGGTILAVGRSSMNLARVLGLPVENHLVERSADGSVTQIPVEKYYVPGSILRIAVDNSAPLAQGMEDHVDVFFDNSPVFTLGPEAVRKGLRPIAWFDTPTPLRSGWAFGQGYVNGGVEIVQATVGKGNLFMFGPEITFRAQPHGTFKFLFNGLYLGAASSAVGSSTNSQASR